MKFIIGFLIVFGNVLGGYVLHKGKLAVLWQPTEVMIIGGAAIGAFIIANPGPLILAVLKHLKCIFKGMPFKKAEYLDVLILQYSLFKTMRSKGMLELESHIENPKDSGIFSASRSLSKDHHALHFLCDHLRLMTMGVENHYELEELMDGEIEAHRNEGKHIAHAVTTMADGLPALGIVAAVLGVIITMGSISEPPEILGKLIGAALVGTFLGVLLSYGLVAPVGKFLGHYMEERVRFLECIRAGLIGYAKGSAPAVAVEYARTSIDIPYKPGFSEVEEACKQTPV